MYSLGTDIVFLAYYFARVTFLGKDKDLQLLDHVFPLEIFSAWGQQTRKAQQAWIVCMILTDFSRLLFFCLISLIPSESRTGIIIMLAVVVVESSTPTCQRGCLERGTNSLFIAQRLKATLGLHYLAVLDRQKEVPLAVEKVSWQCSQGRQDK